MPGRGLIPPCTAEEFARILGTRHCGGELFFAPVEGRVWAGGISSRPGAAAGRCERRPAGRPGLLRRKTLRGGRAFAKLFGQGSIRIADFRLHLLEVQGEVRALGQRLEQGRGRVPQVRDPNPVQAVFDLRGAWRREGQERRWQLLQELLHHELLHLRIERLPPGRAAQQGIETIVRCEERRAVVPDRSWLLARGEAR